MNRFLQSMLSRTKKTSTSLTLVKRINVLHIIVQDILKEVDPEGCQLRKAHRLKKRAYHSVGPNDTWHIDGYDELKPFGFPIHKAMDGLGQK